MSDDFKKRIKLAVEKYEKKNIPKPPRKNESPEADFVKVLLAHLRSKNISVNRVESKAIFNEKMGRYLTGQTDAGFPDIVGNFPNGIALFIEAKAPKKRSTISKSPHQIEFLIDKINTNCFAICCDSIEYFEYALDGWQKSDNKKSFLLNELPTPTNDDLTPLF